MITLKTLPNATAQEVFDQAAIHLLKQNRKADNKEKLCRYIFEGLKCAGGCFIGDDEYKPEMEGIPWSILISQQIVPVDHGGLIVALQRAHDVWEPHEWKERLTAIADANSLNTHAIDNL